MKCLKAQFLATEDPLKMMKNSIYFILKAPFVLKIFMFFVMSFWSCRKKAWVEW